LLARLVALDDFIGDVRPVEAGREDLGIGQRQPLDDIVACMRIGSGCQRDARHAWITLRQQPERAVLRAKIMAPLRNGVVSAERPLILSE